MTILFRFQVLSPRSPQCQYTVAGSKGNVSTSAFCCYIFISELIQCLEIYFECRLLFKKKGAAKP